jgi:DNA-binding response OmpR family regulator
VPSIWPPAELTRIVNSPAVTSCLKSIAESVTSARKVSTERGEIIEVPPVKLDTAQRKVWSAGVEVELTSLEFDMLEVLMRSAGHVLSHAEIIDKLHGRQPGIFDRSIDVHICHVRKKLEFPGQLIRAIRGTGYQFCATRVERTRI